MDDYAQPHVRALRGSDLIKIYQHGRAKMMAVDTLLKAIEDAIVEARLEMAPTDHTHAMEDVTDLLNELDAILVEIATKADTTHVHAYADLTSPPRLSQC